MKEGKIAYLKTDKGFGFINVEGRTKDLFFHAKGSPEVNFADLKMGDAVSFDDVTRTEKGEAAIGVRLL